MNTVKMILVTVMLTGANYLSAQTARIQVIHNASDPAAASVDVYLNGTLAIDNFEFRTATPFIDAPAGEPIDIGIAGSNSTSAADTIKNFNLTLAENETYVAVANGVLDPGSFAANPEGRNTLLSLFIKEAARETAATAGFDFIAVHGSTDAPAVDVIARGTGTLINDAAYSDITDYITVPPASYILDITPADDNSTILVSYEADLRGLDSNAAVVFASGFLDSAANQDGPSFGMFAALPDGSVIELPSIQSARVQVIHNSADVLADTVDVYINGSLLLDDFAFRSATPFIDAEAGVELNIGVAPGNSSSVNDTIKSFTAVLENGGTYIIVANGVLDPGSYSPNPDGRSTAFSLLVKDAARETGTSSDVDFIAVHGSTDAPAVDVIARGIATLVDDAAYSDITDYITVPAAVYTLDLTLADGTTMVQSYTIDLTAFAGGSAVVFASGFLDPSGNQDGEAFGLFYATADGTVEEFPVITDVQEADLNIPADYNLSQNYPNPFNPSTTINFSLPKNEFVTLKVYNILGSEVAALVNRNLSAGTYTYTFDSGNLASGIYFYELNAGGYREIRKMNLLK